MIYHKNKMSWENAWKRYKRIKRLKNIGLTLSVAIPTIAITTCLILWFFGYI